MNRNDYIERVQTLLFLLMRDHLPASKVATVADHVEALRGATSAIYAPSMKGLVKYARELAKRALRQPDPRGLPRPQRLDAEHAVVVFLWRNFGTIPPFLLEEHEENWWRFRVDGDDQNSYVYPNLKIAYHGKTREQDDQHPVGGTANDIENLALLKELTNRHWTIARGTQNDRGRQYSMLIASPGFFLMVSQCERNTPWIVKIVGPGIQGHVLVPVDKGCMTLREAIIEADVETLASGR